MVAEHISNLASSKNSGKRARTQMLVVHSAETPLAAGYAASVTSNWLNRSDVEASINAFFGPDTTVRSVNTDYAAWHATWANGISVGYEFTGYAALTRTQWLTDAGKTMLDRAGREMAEDAKLYGIPLRYLTTAEVNQIANGNTAIKGIATHRQIDPVNRTDPGDGFPYDVLLASIRKYAGGSTTTPTTKPQSSKPPTTITKDWFDMATKDEVKAALREIFAENGSDTAAAKKAGTRDWVLFNTRNHAMAANNGTKANGQALATVVAQTAAIKALAESKPGLDASAVQASIDKAVQGALKDLTVTLSVDADQ